MATIPPASTRADDEAISDAARIEHVQALLNQLRARSPIYGFALATLAVESATCDEVVCGLTLTATHVNSKGGLHGAVSATIVDLCTGLAIAAADLRDTTGANVDMHLSFMSVARPGDRVRVASRLERIGGSLAFVTVRITRVEADGNETLVAMGQHTKYVRGTARSETTRAEMTQP